MFNKGILSLVSLGLLASTLSFTSVHAEGVNDTRTWKEVTRELNRPIMQAVSDSKKFSQLKRDVTLKLPENKNLITNLSNDYVLEKEPNDEFVSANPLSYTKPVIGQLLPMYDIDYHKVTVPSDGLLLIAGQANSYAIDLGFVAVQKDFVDNKNLQFLGYDYDQGIEYQFYQAKKGTYYVGVIDLDYEYDIDNNKEEDLYFIAAAFADNVKPSKPIVNRVDNNDKVVTGKAEANSTITVKNGSKVLGIAKTSSKGAFSVKIAVQKAGAKLTVTAKDSANNVSPAVTVTVKDVIPPKKPTVNKVDDNDKKVTGKAEANATVIVKKGNQTLGSAKANSKGNYTVKIKAQKKGTKLYITAKDAAGNTSPKATKTVVKH